MTEEQMPDYSEFERAQKISGIWQNLIADLEQGIPHRVELEDHQEARSIKASMYNAAKRTGKRITFLNKGKEELWVCWMRD